MEKIRDYIKKNNLLQKGDNLVVGLSGGADSVCLLFELCKLKEEYNLSIHAIHINHMIRETAERDEDFSRELCDKLGIEFSSFKTDCVSLSQKNGLSLEETGRNERYRIFEEEGDRLFGKGNYKIAVAHHSDDLAETFIFNLARGTGIKGLASIQSQNGIVVRPLLGVTKKEIEEYLRENNISHVEDETNSLDEYSRNKIRLNILPLMNEINTNASLHIVQTAASLSEIDDFISKEAAKAWALNVVETDTEIILKNEIVSFHPALQKRIVHDALIKCAKRARDISSVQTKAVLDLFDKQVGRKRNLIYKMTAVKEYDGIHLYLDENSQEEVLTLESVKISVEERDFSKEIPGEMYTKWFDYDKIINRPVVRFRQKGDYLYVGDNVKKSLSDYMINEKIPAKMRDNIPLVADGNHILWVVGYRISSAVKVSDETKRVLTARCLKQE